jgi:hypothetical protein
MSGEVLAMIYDESTKSERALVCDQVNLSSNGGLLCQHEMVAGLTDFNRVSRRTMIVLNTRNQTTANVIKQGPKERR